MLIKKPRVCEVREAVDIDALSMLNALPSSMLQLKTGFWGHGAGLTAERRGSKSIITEWTDRRYNRGVHSVI